MSGRVKEVQEDPHGSDCECRLLVQLILGKRRGMSIEKPGKKQGRKDTQGTVTSLLCMVTKGLCSGNRA